MGCQLVSQVWFIEVINTMSGQDGLWNEAAEICADSMVSATEWERWSLSIVHRKQTTQLMQ
jgi:hypothetical protein